MGRTFSYLSLLLGLLIVSGQGDAAGFALDATRLIYPADVGYITVPVRNSHSQLVLLVQGRVSSQQNSQARAPFVVAPTLFRLEPGGVNHMRIIFNGDSLPADRESVFWFHAGAIPMSSAPASEEGAPALQNIRFGVGNIIKIFYRPLGLAGSSVLAQKGLRFSQEGGHLKVSNPSPYFVSLAGLSVNATPLMLDTAEARMLSPFGSHIWKMSPSLTSGSRLHWRAINDHGGLETFDAVLP